MGPWVEVVEVVWMVEFVDQMECIVKMTSAIWQCSFCFTYIIRKS